MVCSTSRLYFIGSFFFPHPFPPSLRTCHPPVRPSSPSLPNDDVYPRQDLRPRLSFFFPFLAFSSLSFSRLRATLTPPHFFLCCLSGCCRSLSLLVLPHDTSHSPSRLRRVPFLWDALPPLFSISHSPSVLPLSLLHADAQGTFFFEAKLHFSKTPPPKPPPKSGLVVVGGVRFRSPVRFLLVPRQNSPCEKLFTSLEPSSCSSPPLFSPPGTGSPSPVSMG